MRGFAFSLLRGGANGAQVACWFKPRLLLPPTDGVDRHILSRVAAPEPNGVPLATYAGAAICCSIGGPDAGPWIATALVVSQICLLGVVFSAADRLLAAEARAGDVPAQDTALESIARSA